MRNEAIRRPCLNEMVIWTGCFVLVKRSMKWLQNWLCCKQFVYTGSKLIIARIIECAFLWQEAALVSHSDKWIAKNKL